MDAAPDKGSFRDRLAAAFSRAGARFWEEPALVSIRLIAVIFVVVAVIGLVLNSLGIAPRFGMDPMSVLLLVLLAWVLSSNRVGQIVIGAFLAITFILSIVLLILPVEAIVDSFTRVLKADLATHQSARRTAQKVTEAQHGLSFFLTQHPELQDNYFLRDANNALSAAAQILPAGDEDVFEKLVKDISETVAELLRKSAPFVFTMLMGLMGSAIAVSRQFVSNFEEKPAVWYLYRLLQGMIIALLIVYGLVAGMLSLGVNTGNQPIDISRFDTNKYFIGFVSALAGLFSEHAFARLESVSSNLFGKTGKKDAEQVQPAEPDTTPQSNGGAATGRQDVEGSGSKT